MSRTVVIAGTLLMLVRSHAGAEPGPAAEAPLVAEAPAAVDAAANAAAGEPAGMKRDPFRPFTLDLRPEVPHDAPLTPLQRYELPQLRVAAILLHTLPPRAMLEDNSGMGFIVTPGTPIGRNRGVVKTIESRRIVVEEKTLDYYGNEQVQNVVLEMPQDHPQDDGQGR